LRTPEIISGRDNQWYCKAIFVIKYVLVAEAERLEKSFE